MDSLNPLQICRVAAFQIFYHKPPFDPIKIDNKLIIFLSLDGLYIFFLVKSNFVSEAFVLILLIAVSTNPMSILLSFFYFLPSKLYQ